MTYLAGDPEMGAVIPGSGGCRKIRWSMAGTGKRGAVRVIYTAQLASGALVILLMYAKGATETIPAHILRNIAKDLNNAPD